MKTSPRRLTRQHFALYRGWLEGAALEGLHRAWGEPGTDVRITRRLIATLRDTLAVAARRAQDIEAAHLLRLKPGSIPLAELHGRDDVPTLEDYRAQVDPDGVYGEAELIALYRGDFPPPPSPARDRKIARNARLRARQAAALERMERALVQDPAPEHPLETAPSDTPLIAHLKTGKPLSPDALARLYKVIFKRAADALAPTYPGAAADLKRASTHWLRHTHANHALDAGSDLRDVQTGLGHASLGTTTLYTKGDAARQYRAVERFFEAALDETVTG